MKRLLWLIVAVLMLCPGRALAQADAAFTNYWTLQSYFNPAASGLNGQLNVNAAYSMQMLGFENAPATMLASADLPVFFIGPNHGMGAGFLNDKVGLFSNRKIYVQYAYHLPLWGGRLSVGVRPGLLTESFDGTKVDAGDSGDPAFSSSQVDGNAFDLDLGFRYTYKDTWYAGLSAMHCLMPTVSLGDDKMNEVSVDPIFYLTGGYKLKFRQPQYQLHTSAILRTDLMAWRADLTARLAYAGEKMKMCGGLTYSPMTAVAFLLGFDFHGVTIGYSYEIYTGGISALNGSHELIMGYQTDLNLFKKGKNLHKSVRFL